jgi:hypothetical protein
MNLNAAPCRAANPDTHEPLIGPASPMTMAFSGNDLAPVGAFDRARLGRAAGGWRI